MSARMKSYCEQLCPSDRLIYNNKCVSIDGIDPYLVPTREFSHDVDTWPAITHGDIVNYLVFSANPLYNMQQMKAYKGLDAHNQFTSGWVRDVGVAFRNNTAIIHGKVISVCTEYGLLLLLLLTVQGSV